MDSRAINCTEQAHRERFDTSRLRSTIGGHKIHRTRSRPIQHTHLDSFDKEVASDAGTLLAANSAVDEFHLRRQVPIGSTRWTMTVPVRRFLEISYFGVIGGSANVILKTLLAIQKTSVIVCSRCGGENRWTTISRPDSGWQ